jgi:hypothetical protein
MRANQPDLLRLKLCRQAARDFVKQVLVQRSHVLMVPTLGLCRKAPAWLLPATEFIICFFELVLCRTDINPRET